MAANVLSVSELIAVLTIYCLLFCPLFCWVLCKAGDETRTHDIQLGKLTFYH
jgi:hypothetical protein